MATHPQANTTKHTPPKGCKEVRKAWAGGIPGLDDKLLLDEDTNLIYMRETGDLIGYRWFNITPGVPAGEYYIEYKRFERESKFVVRCHKDEYEEEIDTFEFDWDESDYEELPYSYQMALDCYKSKIESGKYMMVDILNVEEDDEGEDIHIFRCKEWFCDFMCAK